MWVLYVVLATALGVSAGHRVTARSGSSPIAYQAQTLAPPRSPTQRGSLPMQLPGPAQQVAPQGAFPTGMPFQGPSESVSMPFVSGGDMPLSVGRGAQRPQRQCCPSPEARPILAVDCQNGACAGWSSLTPQDFQPFGQGEYVGHSRLAHVCEYRLRVDDVLEFVFRLTREEQSHPYELNVGDEIRVESFTDATLNRDLIIQPDGTITLRLVGQVRATRHNVAQLRDEIENLYKRYYKEPAITVTPLKVNTKLEDLRAAVDRRQGFGGQNREARVTPEGTIALPAIGSVFVQGMTLEEVKEEIDARYAEEVEGLEVTPVLTHRAPRYVYVVGEVRLPGRYTLEGPTTVMQAVTLAGGWNVGGNLRQVVVFRRGDDWRLMATLLDIRGALYGKVPCPADEIWINDSDIVVVPKAPIRVFDDYVKLIFTEGLYHIVPFGTNVNFSFLNTLQNAAAAGS
jgi:polysaccharide export outer membrane protein